MPQLALLLSTMVWGATFPATKAALDQIRPFPFLFLRFLIGLLLTAGIVLVVKKRLQADRDMIRMSSIATVFLFLGYALQTAGLRYTTASNSAFITALYVVLVPLFLRRFQGMIWLSAGLALAGLWLLVTPSLAMNVGDLMTVGCAAAFAVHIACLETYTRKGDQSSLFLWQLLFVTMALLPAMLLERPEAAQFIPTPLLVVALVITGVCATGAFAIQMWAQRFLPAQRVALIFSLEPAYAAWLSWYFLGERLDQQAWLGSGLILIAVILGSATGSVAGVREPARSTPLA
jgi:drug/metabolite transporter (DMT)-like permease